ncbi:outer membrane protein assembly factor BamE [Rhodovarius sp.]|uniref:outer membrane protein assembly factor BamE n=1 Tax=Rhodovarius sp. TaxID=2972673 RepID=UPI0034A247E1
MEPTPLKVNATPPLARALAVLACLGVAGCQYLPPLPERPREVFSSPIIARGHLVSAEQLQQITPGVTARADVQALLGSPSHTATFSDDTWYYISSSTQLRPGRALSVSNQRVVVVAFNPNGTVRELRELGQADGRNLSFASRETPVPGNDRTLLQGLFGNIGRFNPTGSSTGQPAAPGVANSSNR